MPLTSTQIHEQSFKVDRRGYSVEEVDIFLEHVATGVDELNAEISRLHQQIFLLQEELAQRANTPASAPSSAPVSQAPAPSISDTEKDARIADLERKLEERKMEDNAIAKALIVAQRSGDEVISKAKADADRILNDAEEEATRILDKANVEKQRIVETIDNLSNDREAVRGEYQDLLKGFISSASKKLAELGGDLDSSRFAPSAEKIYDIASPQIPKRDAALAVATYTTPNRGNYVAPAAPKPSRVEKDFSGFGDADDAFDVDDID